MQGEGSAAVLYVKAWATENLLTAHHRCSGWKLPCRKVEAPQGKGASEDTESALSVLRDKIFEL